MHKQTLQKLMTDMYDGMLKGQKQFKHYQNKQNENKNIQSICRKSN